MDIDTLEELSRLCNSMYVLDALKDALNKSYWIKFSTPYCEPSEISGGEIGYIMEKHLKNALKEIEEYIENIKVLGLEVEQ